ncbi:PH domain-containing protein [Streptomyces lushanensis]|uniref:PH domain-containing protein n=1 Tax=Streptomyces lushanensis TaxID=1434255 RepID=UPI00114CADAA|nr:PH domain-containing protein [Streptomyces lushanensis]
MSSSVAAVGVLVPMWIVAEFPNGVSVSVTLLLVGILGWMIHVARQLATVADLKGIRTRGFLRVRRMAWEEIQEIHAAPNPGAITQDNAPSTIAYAYGKGGRRRLLPYVDDLHVDVVREVRVLNEIWQELRGEDWTADENAAIDIARDQVRRKALAWGVGCSMFSFLPLTGLALLPVFFEFPGWTEPVMNPFVILGGGWVAVFGITAALVHRGNRPAG